ncbi:type II secretion system protein GspH [Pseudomonas sp. SDI]|uniref:prepilin-type N-terminal cleavage/methylation domain-containing protein n=1 Tax=Pseudomonas sp. SDI TaxID=2170734 RepID=UPI000DE72385|nr:prepilin-type N-terminal cleavage/methylation domain-containing protein [Pseudomonas sp. SDI]PWB31113.1 type II secretion system protein GspH [Pseudomonas sp. SDI]
MRRACAGFTLLELLIVLALMALAVSMTGLVGTRDPAREARQEAAGMLELLQHGRQLALSEGREYGLCVSPAAVQLMRWGGASWQPQGAALLAASVLQLSVQGQGVQLPARCREPQVLLSSSDEISEFRLRLNRDGKPLAQVVGNGLDDPRSED